MRPFVCSWDLTGLLTLNTVGGRYRIYDKTDLLVHTLKIPG
jgi:hypothetical protein